MQIVLSKPTGGQTEPNSTVGAKLAWKYAQNQLIKNITSETTNRIKPNFNPERTLEL